MCRPVPPQEGTALCVRQCRCSRSPHSSQTACSLCLRLLKRHAVLTSPRHCHSASSARLCCGRPEGLRPLQQPRDSWCGPPQSPGLGHTPAQLSTGRLWTTDPQLDTQAPPSRSPGGRTDLSCPGVTQQGTPIALGKLPCWGVLKKLKSRQVQGYGGGAASCPACPAPRG